MKIASNNTKIGTCFFYGRTIRLITLLFILLLATCPVRADNKAFEAQPAELFASMNAPVDPNWYGFASGNDTRSNLVFDGNYIWSGSGGGVIRWDKTTGDYRMFMPSDGLVTYAVDSIVKDRGGSLWFGTYAGLTRYNGHDWINYSCSEIGFCSVWRSVMDASGNLWFGGYHSGLSKFDGTTWTRYTSDATGVQTTKNINALAADSVGGIWALSTLNSVQEIHKFDGTTWTTINKDAIPNCTDYLSMLNVAPNDDLWVTCSTSLARLHNGSWTSFGSDKGVTFYPNSISFGADGTVFAGGSGVYQLNNEGNFVPVFTGFSMGSYNNSLAVDSTGKVWAGTNMGLAIWDGSTTTQFLTTHHLSNNYLRGMAIDSIGSFWVASANGQNSINQFDGSSWITHCPFGGSDQTCSGGNGIAQDSAENVWVAGSGLAKFNGTTWNTYTTPDAESLDFSVVAAENSADIWTATGQKLFKFDGVSGWSNYPLPDTNFHTWRDIAIQGSNVWLADHSGLYKWNGSTWTVFSTSNGLPSNVVDGIAANATDLWAATDGGVAHYNGTTWNVYTSTDGLANNSILDVVFAPDGSVWAGLSNWGGLAHFNGTAWTSTNSNYLVNGKAGELIFDKNGNLWINNEGFGIRVFNPNGLINTKTIPDVGGVVNSLDGTVTLEINPQVFNEPVIVTIQSLGSASAQGVGESYEIDAVSAATHQQVQLNPGQTLDLSLQYNPSSLNASIENTLALYYWNGTQWVKDPSSQLNITNRVVTAHPNHLSRWAILPDMQNVFLPLLMR